MSAQQAVQVTVGLLLFSLLATVLIVVTAVRHSAPPNPNMHVLHNPHACETTGGKCMVFV